MILCVQRKGRDDIVIETKGTDFTEFLREVSDSSWVVATIVKNKRKIAIDSKTIESIIELDFEEFPRRAY